MRKMEPIENLRVGLTAQQVEESRRQHGDNGLTYKNGWQFISAKICVIIRYHFKNEITC